ncbi:RNA polymerase II subunit B1 CTD phosphatase Rpap2 [Diorhabda carinulata]|uniref:RNA polymerase II subunit B1 CTD phosphatase Rpap2 n=1 Tax=Diorhabda carinulata TaxID=1163345 RepID=UPI0025A0283D|nr:RNA polymerase II subunit B1 CTD phosphatase Rpap2 [Diorhabda carinulata]
MRDSLDDFVRLSNNIKSEEPSREIKKELLITAQRKKECETRAMKIVEFSIEGKLRPEIFTKCLPFINQSHYQDIVEERAIIKLCGYSVCGKSIPEMPKKQFFISTKNNKVYDITDRKNYCSNFCYKASIHIKNQIDDSPLWLRKLDDIPEYQFLASNDGGLPGEYIDQGISKPVAESTFTSIGKFTQFSLSDIINKEQGSAKEQNKDKQRRNKKKTSRLVKTMQTITETEQTEEEEQQQNESIRTDLSAFNLQKSSSLPVIIENEENFENKLDLSEKSPSTSDISIKVSSKKTKKKIMKPPKVDIEGTLRKVIKEWVTLESLIFLHGESKVKEILNEKKLGDCFEKLSIDKLQTSQQIKYMDICRRLQLREMADEKFDNSLLGNKLKPLPDYAKLKQENKDLNVKVKCFYSGVMLEKEDSNFPTKINKSEENKDSEDIPVVLPLVDVNSQKALRRKIFLNAVNKSMQQLLQALRIKFYNTILSDLQNLVKTFNLNADNIVFRPVMWNYISIILVHMLSIRDNNLKVLLEEQASREYIGHQLSILPNKEVILSDILNEVSNIDSFVEIYISSN